MLCSGNFSALSSRNGRLCNTIPTYLWMAFVSSCSYGNINDPLCFRNCNDVVSRSIGNINYEAFNLAIYFSLLFFLPLISSYLLSTLLSHFPVAGNIVFFVTSKCSYFLGAFAKLRNATVSFVMSVCPHGTTRLPLDGFS